MSKLSGISRCRKNSFFIGNINCNELTKKNGSPLVFVSIDRVKDNYCSLRKSLDKHYPNSHIAYALKANYSKPILDCLLENGAYIETISKLEYEIASKAGFSPNKIIFNGLGRKREELRNALKHGSIINIDSCSEMKLIAELSQTNIKVGLRINPKVKLPGLFVPKSSKLGLTFSEVKKCMQIAISNKIEINGISFHVFHNLANPIHLSKVMRAAEKFKDYLEKKQHKPIQYIDIGGGWAPKILLTHDNQDVFIEKVQKEMETRFPERTLILEPGRHLVGDAVCILSQVTAIKKNGNTNWVVMDIGTNYIIPAPGYSPIVNTCKKGNKHVVNVVDGICSPAGMITKGIKLPNLTEKDYLVIENCGAYMGVMAEQFVFPIPTTIFIKNNMLKKVIVKKSLQEILEHHGWV